MRIGVHVSAAGGIDKAIDRAVAIGANCAQIFAGSPRSWNPTVYSDEVASQFIKKAQEFNVGPIFIHALYLTNLATSKPDLRQKTIEALSRLLRVADQIGVQGVIFHTGSAGLQDKNEALFSAISAMKEILKAAPGKSQLIIENSAGQGGTVGNGLEEISQMYHGVGSDRLKVCLDTCHLFAAGIDVRDEKIVDKFLIEFDKKIGLKNLVVIHANDSKFELGGHRDRHENIGEGEIGLTSLKVLINHPKLKNLPWILEVPGFDETGPDKKNIEILRGLVS